MNETGDTVDLLPFAKQVNASLQKQSIIQSTLYENWLVEIFFGPSPAVDGDLPRLGFTACASTQDSAAGPTPVLGDTYGVRVDFDEKSIVWWSGSTLDELKNKIETAFPEINLEQKED